MSPPRSSSQDAAPQSEAAWCAVAGSERAEGPEHPRDRLPRLVRDHFAFVWRMLRRSGIGEADADDAAQQVFMIAARRLEEISPGSERAFLLSTALHVAAKAHRTRMRRREVLDVDLDEDMSEAPLSMEELVDRRRARDTLDSLVQLMPEELRTIFVLYELEELTMAEIAALLHLPQGTVASRLRRARADFQARIARIEAAIGARGALR